MIINNEEVIKRLNSPLNLINRLRETKSSARAKEAMSIFIKPKQEEKKPTKPSDERSEAPILDSILENNEAQIKLGLAHDSALKLLNNSIFALSAKLDDVKAEKLPAAILAASKVVESIRRERAEASKNNKDREVHYHFYTPEQKTIEQYEVIDVG